MGTYLFDFDGTLVDSVPTYTQAMLSVLEENNIKYNNDIGKIITPLGYKGVAEYFQTLGVRLPVDEIVEKMIVNAQKGYENTIPAKERVVESLMRLLERGDSLNVLTASPHRLLDPCLKRLKIYDLFQNVWSCDDFGTGKTNPEIYTQAARRLGKNIENIVFLDDNLNALKAAKIAGARVYGVYDSSSEDYRQEILNICDRYIVDFSQLI